MWVILYFNIRSQKIIILKYYRIFRIKYFNEGLKDEPKLKQNDHQLKSILSKIDLSVVNEHDETEFSFSNSDDSSSSSSFSGDNYDIKSD